LVWSIGTPAKLERYCWVSGIQGPPLKTTDDADDDDNKNNKKIML